MISQTEGGVKTHDKHRTQAPNPMTTLSLIETPSRSFEDLISGDEVENSTADESSAGEDTNTTAKNDAAEIELTVTENCQGIDKVENEVENAETPPKQIVASRKTIKESKKTIKMIAGKEKMIVMLICEEMGKVG